MITVCRQDRIPRVGLQKLENNICWLRGFALNVLWDIFCKTEEAHMYSIICVLIRAIMVSHVVLVLFANSFVSSVSRTYQKKWQVWCFCKLIGYPLRGFLCTFDTVCLVSCSLLLMFNGLLGWVLFSVALIPLRQITIFIVSPLWPLC